MNRNMSRTAYSVFAFAVAAFFATAFLFAPEASAQGWGTAAQSMTQETRSIGKLFLFAGYMVGIGCVVYGLIKFVGHKKKQEPVTDALFPLVGGSLLLAVLVVVNLTSQSVVQQGASGVDALQLNNG